MGTRADFYLGRGKDAEWLGSVAYDGDPTSILTHSHLGACTTAEAFQDAIARELEPRDDWTRPEDGWPWSWTTSHNTDWSYSFDQGAVLVSNYGHAWMTTAEAVDAKRERCSGAKVDFPDMSERQNITFGRRSGSLLFRS